MIIITKNKSKFENSKNKVTIGIQEFHMKIKFPNFKFYKNGHLSFGWIGNLKPTESSAEYTVKIQYDHRHPRVYICNPEMLKNAPHQYNDGRLCLYYPKDQSYNNMSIIADTILPWTVLWLYYYEVWIQEGVWWGPEAPHLPDSVEGRKVNRKYK